MELLICPTLIPMDGKMRKKKPASLTKSSGSLMEGKSKTHLLTMTSMHLLGVLQPVCAESSTLTWTRKHMNRNFRKISTTESDSMSNISTQKPSPPLGFIKSSRTQKDSTFSLQLQTREIFRTTLWRRLNSIKESLSTQCKYCSKTSSQWWARLPQEIKSKATHVFTLETCMWTTTRSWSASHCLSLTRGRRN